MRQEVRSAQRTLAALDQAHARAVARLERAQARRSEALTELDRRVAEAQAEVEAAVVAMATTVSAEFASTVLHVPLADVRRLVRQAAPKQQTNGSGSAFGNGSL